MFAFDTETIDFPDYKTLCVRDEHRRRRPHVIVLGVVVPGELLAQLLVQNDNTILTYNVPAVCGKRGKSAGISLLNTVNGALLLLLAATLCIQVMKIALPLLA